MYEDEHLESDYESRNGSDYDFEDEEDGSDYYDESDESDEDDEDVTSYYPVEVHDRVKSVVAAGMAYLDENYPDHRERVDITNLLVEDDLRCPLAQAAQKSYYVVFFPIDATETWSQDHGFSGELWRNYSTWDLLTQAWKDAYNAV